MSLYIGETQIGRVVVGAPSGGSDVLVVTLSWDADYFGSGGAWIPDKTFAEIQAAYEAGKEIVVNTDLISEEATADGEYLDEGTTPYFNYWVHIYSYDIIDYHYRLTSESLQEISSAEYVLPNFSSPSVTYTPSNQTQTDTITPGSGYNGIEEVSVTINAMPSGTAGTPTATKGTVSSNSVTVTPSVTNTAGYISGGTINGTAVTVSASELVSGTKNITSSGTTDVTNYASASVASGTVTAPASISGTTATVSTGTNTLTLSKTVSVTPSVTTAGYISSGTAGNSSVSLTANVTTKAAATITPTGSQQTIASGTYLTGTQTIQGVVASNLTAENIKKGVTVKVGTSTDDDSVTSVTGTYEGSGGGGGLKLATATSTLASASNSISFTGLLGEPTSFSVVSASNLATGASPYKTAAVVFDGTNVIGQYITNTNNAQMTYSSSAFSKSYSNGTLTISGTGSNFQANQYKLTYTYDGSSANIATEQVQVGSGATSITFTGLSDEPTYWSCLFTSNIGTSSGYTRAHVVVFDGSDIYGMEMGSGSNATSNWNATYNNGSLTISSQSTSAGGYFHQPGYYQLTYAVGGEIEITTEPLEVTSNGTYTAPRGKAYTPVVVSVSGGGSSKNIQVNSDAGSVRTTSYSSTGISITVAKAGTYNVSWMSWKSSSSGTMGTNLYVNGNAGTNQTTWTNTYGQHITLTNQTYAAGDVLTLYAVSSNTSRYCGAGNLIIEEQ